MTSRTSKNKNTTTVTLDGKFIGTRTSQSRIYTHAVIEMPATPEARKAAFNREAQRLEALAKILETAAEEGKVAIRTHLSDRHEDDYFHSHAIALKGTQALGQRGTYDLVADHANHKGEIETWAKYAMGLEPVRETRKDYWGEQMYAYQGRDYLIAKARQMAQQNRESAKLLREQGEQPDPAEPTVIRWSSSEELALKAANGKEFAYLKERYGRTLMVVPVD